MGVGHLAALMRPLPGGHCGRVAATGCPFRGTSDSMLCGIKLIASRMNLININ